MKVYSFIVAYDYGFAPNPFHGVCTLACCKPMIRRSAQPGDLVVGLSSRAECVVFAMKIDRVLTFKEYWEEPRFVCKRPDMNARDRRSREGDNIYEPKSNGRFRQLPSRHSPPYWTENRKRQQMRNDLSGKHVVTAKRYVYYGGGQRHRLPPRLAFLRVGRGHRCRFSEHEIEQVARWFARLSKGVRGEPARWPQTDESWSSHEADLQSKGVRFKRGRVC
jgi:Nucleotide modification associated domain 2